VILSILIPFCVIEIGGLLALAGPMPLLPAGHAPAQLAAFQAAQRAWHMTSTLQMQRLWFITYPLAGLLTALFYGLSCGAQVFAYRTLTQDEGLAPIAGD
ncbi:MAG TPA: hypothetical protein VK515_08680, partial [Rhizomicrobium sp.]|nr:hypothetical protein [Rhizomicrobium sp.]